MGFARAQPIYGLRAPGMIPAGLVLRAGQRDLTFGAEHVAVKARNPLASARRHVEVTYFSLNMRRHTVPIKLRVAVDDVGGRFVAKLAIHAYLFEFMVERVCFPEVVGISELPTTSGKQTRSTMNSKR